MPIRYKTGEQTFTLPCFRTLVKSLGEFDSLVEYQELANRMLLASFDQSKESFSDYLKRQSKIHGIYLNEITLQGYMSSQIQGYLFYPCACFDAFLSGFENEVRLLINSKYILDELKGSHIQKIIDALKKISVTLDIDKKELDVYNYYRELRNDLAHILCNDCSSEYDAIDQESIKDLYPKLQAPNKKSTLCFDDFILCTAVVKDIAFQMTSSLYSITNWEERAVANKKTWFKNYDRYSDKNENERRKNCVYNSLLTLYGVRMGEYELENIVEKLAHKDNG